MAEFSSASDVANFQVFIIGLGLPAVSKFGANGAFRPVKMYNSGLVLFGLGVLSFGFPLRLFKLSGATALFGWRFGF